MSKIANSLSDLHAGQSLAHERLTVHPLFSDSGLHKDYLTLDEALKAGEARVTEVSEAGSVPNLLFHNLGTQAVFLLDGEELVGAKQNRILNITILAPAKQETVIPVSCVEAGRWHHASREFSSAPRAQFSESRARKASAVSSYLRTDAGPRSDQGELWDDIAAKMCRMGSHSGTGAMERVFEDHEDALGQYVDRLGVISGQVGAVFAIRGRVVGMELFDTAETCRLLMPKIIRSYALDAIDPAYRGYASSSLDAPEQIMELLEGAPYSSHASVGEGRDLRFDSTPGLVGGALYARDRVVHLCAFVIAQHSRENDDRDYRTRASRRRHFRDAA